MTVFKTTLLAATALTLLTGAALAGDNKAYIHQGGAAGGKNEASITQQGVGNNQAGKADEPGGAIDQGADYSWGAGNKLTISQNGGNLKVGVTGELVSDGQGFQGAGVDQYGNKNSANVTQTGSGNTVGSILQQNYDANVAGNVLTIEQSNSGNKVDYAGQKYVANNGVDAANVATLTFTGQNNGTNGLEGSAGQAEKYGAGAAIAGAGSSSSNGVWQVGAGNKIGLSVGGNDTRFAIRQTGASNEALGLTITGNQTSLAINQDGQRNKATVSALGSGSDENNIGIFQKQTDNTATVTVVGSLSAVGVRQDGIWNESTVNASGDGNNLFHAQKGNFNIATTTATGDGNYVNTDQDGNNNVATVKITGNNNNSDINFDGSVFSDKSDMIARVTTTFSQTGNIIQKGGSTKKNDVNITVRSDNNRFSTYQDGNGNEIVGRIGSVGGGNQAFVAQIGSNNLTNFSQNGTGNMLAVVQK